MVFCILSYKKPDYFLIRYEYTQAVNGTENIVKDGYCLKIDPQANGAILVSKDRAKKFKTFKEAKKYIQTNAIFRENKGNRTWEETNIYSVIYNWNEFDTFDYECFEIEEVYSYGCNN